MLVDGNDDRGIDVGILIRGRFPLEHVRTHIFDTDPDGVIFSRDCCEYHLSTPTGQRLAVLVNHLKSKGYSTREDPQGGKRRQRQATRIAQIYRDLPARGWGCRESHRDAVNVQVRLREAGSRSAERPQPG